MRKFIWGMIFVGAVLLLVGELWNLNRNKEHAYEVYQQEIGERNEKIQALEDSIRQLHRQLGMSSAVGEAHPARVKKQEKVDQSKASIDANRLRQMFEENEWLPWESSEYHFTVMHPVFMQIDDERTSTSGVWCEFNDIRLIAKAYKDEAKMSLEQKYMELNSSANTMSMQDNYFLLAGWIDEERRYFEKDIKIGDNWYYIRAEFPQEYTRHIDKLLQYVKNYDPFDAPRIYEVSGF